VLINSRRPENDAEHSWHLCLIVITLAEHANSPQLNVLRVLQMLILHDLVEIDAGDTLPTTLWRWPDNTTARPWRRPDLRPATGRPKPSNPRAVG